MDGDKSTKIQTIVPPPRFLPGERTTTSSSRPWKSLPRFHCGSRSDRRSVARDRYDARTGFASTECRSRSDRRSASVEIPGDTPIAPSARGISRASLDVKIDPSRSLRQLFPLTSQSVSAHHAPDPPTESIGRVPPTKPASFACGREIRGFISGKNASHLFESPRISPKREGAPCSRRIHERL